MTQSLETLSQRTGTLESIHGIVRTMKTVSAINAPPFEQAARAIEAYRDTVLDGLHALLYRHGPLGVGACGDALEIVIAFGSDHGLCGGYNEAVATEVARHPAAHLICVGAQLQDALHSIGQPAETVLLPPASVDGLGRIARQLVTRLEDARASAGGGRLAVTLIYTERRPHAQHTPVAQRLLPLDLALIADLARRPWRSRSLPQSRQPPAAMLAALLRGFLFASLFRASAEAMLTENAARLARMQQAEQSVDERLQDLRAQTRAVRQSAITTELLDVIIGFEALKDRGREKRRRLDGSR